MLSQHLGLATALIVIGFVIGIYGHITKSLTLILIGIVIIALISLLFVADGEVSTFSAIFAPDGF